MSIWIALGSFGFTVICFVGKIIYDYSRLSSKVSVLEERVGDIDKVVKSDAISIAKLTETMSYIKETVFKLDNKIDELLRR